MSPFHSINHRTNNASLLNNESAVDSTISNQAGGSASQYYDSASHGFAPEAAMAQILDRNLRSDPGYRPPNQARDFFIPKPAKTTLRWKITPWQDLVKRTPEIKGPGPNIENDPLVHSFLPWGDPMENPLTSDDAPYGTARDLFDLNPQSGPQTFPLATHAVSEDPVFIESQFGPITHQSEPSPPPQRLSNHPKVSSNRCIECTFARTKCERVPGSPCGRCTRLSIFKGQVKTASDYVDFIGHVVVIDVELTQTLLSALRDEAGALTGLKHGQSLEDVFDGTMFCHMNYLAGPNSDTRSGVSVVIRHLATTWKAKAAATNSSVPLPALDAHQMDTFIDLGNRLSDLGSLQPVEKNIIVTAFRCSACLGFLFNWNHNVIYYEEGRRGASIPQAKNLVLETVFSIAYRVAELMTMLSFEVIKSLTEPENPDHDPGTISYALWIVYSSLNTFSKLAWEAKSLQNLKRFLNELHGRAPGALVALQRYRQEVAFKRCGKFSPNLTAFKEHVYEKKVPQSLISLTYERQSNMITLPTYSRQQSYTDVLEARAYDEIFLEESSPAEIQHKSSAAYSTVTLEELQKRDGTLTRGSKGGSMKTYSGSAMSESSNNYDDVPPLTIKTTIEDSETGLDAEISRVKSRLKYLKGIKTRAVGVLKSKTTKISGPEALILGPIQPRSGIASHFAISKAVPGEEAMVLETARPKQRLRCQKKKRAQLYLTSKTLSIASGSSSHQSPQPKRQRRSSLKPHGSSDDSNALDVKGMLNLGEVPDVEEGNFSAFFLDHEFNPDFMRDDSSVEGV